MLYLWLCIMTFNKVQVLTSKIIRSPSWVGWPLLDICFTNDHGYDPLVLSTSLSFPHTRLINGFVTILTRRVALVEQGLLTFPDHLSSTPVFSYSICSFICMLCRSLLVLCTFIFKPLYCLSCNLLASDYLFEIFILFLLSRSRINIWNDTGIESIICPVLRVRTEHYAYSYLYDIY
jgi:hypothetical protein